MNLVAELIVGNSELSMVPMTARCCKFKTCFVSVIIMKQL